MGWCCFHHNRLFPAGGSFLEAPVSGSKGPAAQGQLIFLCGGDEAAYTAVAAELDLMGKVRARDNSCALFATRNHSCGHAHGVFLFRVLQCHPYFGLWRHKTSFGVRVGQVLLWRGGRRHAHEAGGEHDDGVHVRCAGRGHGAGAGIRPQPGAAARGNAASSPLQLWDGVGGSKGADDRPPASCSAWAFYPTACVRRCWTSG